MIGSNAAYGSLLRSIVEVARAIFGAQRSSIFLLDEEADELVFEAIAGEEEQGLIGTRIPSSTGIAGWTLVTRQPLVIEDLTQDPRHAREVAKSTGYVPKGIMSVPLLVEERALGVLQVLDRPQRPGFTLQEMELLGLFANQAAIALDLLQRSRRAQAALETRERGRRGGRSAGCRARRARGGRPREGAAAARGAGGRSAQMRRAPWRRPSQNSGRGSKGGRGRVPVTFDVGGAVVLAVFRLSMHLRFELMTLDVGAVALVVLDLDLIVLRGVHALLVRQDVLLSRARLPACPGL